MFFNLSLKDAIIYVYTKTIYVVPEDIRQKHTLTLLEKQELENIQEHIHKYCNLVDNIVILSSFQNSTLNKKDIFLKDVLEIIKLGIINLRTNTDTINECIYKKIEQCNNEILYHKDSNLDTVLEMIQSIFSNELKESVEL